ncbi:ABC transporter permease [Luteolibacter algae]|uniref:ABC transporter permease n=1 Tax=Luteolibacter algae TaxID=454151 RepID=A0ABW5D5H5_9BACT
MYLNDFSDRLSPMLVKELRQGLRTKSFIAVFLTLQILLGVILLTAGVAASSDHAGSTISNIIFIIFSIAVMVIQPMRGVASLSAEIKDNTIDMIVLTRLSAWRIVIGKWSAIVSQSGLILITIIPYLILRYFFGGMNLLGEIIMIALIFLSSAALTAITVGLSATGSVLLRSIIPVVFLPVAAFSLFGVLLGGSPGGNLAEFCSLESPESRIAISLYVLTCAYMGFFFLSIGTSLIAPYAENHSTLRRLLTLLITILAAITSSTSFTHSDALPFIFALIFAPIFTISLTEFAPLVPPTYQKFRKFGLLGKLSGPFLFPGWPSGVFFCLLITLIAIIPFLANGTPYRSEEQLTVTFATLGTLLFPAVIINLFKMKGPQRISNYILFAAGSCIVAMVLLGVSESMSNRDFLWVFVWIPPVIFAMLASSINDTAVLFASIIVDATLFLILIIIALRHYRKSIDDITTNYPAGE